MKNWASPSELDRGAGAQRDEANLDAAWRRALVLRVDVDGSIAAVDGAPSVVPASGKRGEDDIYLGVFSGSPWFARPVARLDGESITWREVPPDESDPLASAVSLARWHGLRPLCERCGSPTLPADGGSRRVCTGCGLIAFPRIDPCVIVAITDIDDRLLLASNVAWQRNRVSVIAGFIEAGESAEQACHREVGEEVGLRLDSLSYVGSEPWPMPRSLMLGFEARASDTRIQVDGDEIVDGGFYTRPDLVAAVASGQLVLPGVTSIARRLIERWLSGR